MKESLRLQNCDMIPGKTGWENFISDCISSGICPKCGNGLNPGVTDKTDKDHREVVLFGCSKCEWQDYTQVAFKSSDRHGLV